MTRKTEFTGVGFDFKSLLLAARSGVQSLFMDVVIEVLTSKTEDKNS